MRAHDDTVLVQPEVCGSGTHSDLGDTDVEDELETMTVEADLRRVVVGEEVRGQTDRRQEGVACVPVVVQGRRKEAFDHNLDFDEMVSSYTQE